MMPNFPDINMGEVSLPTSAPVDASTEDAIIGTDERNPHEPMLEDEDAQRYFDSVDDEEALNYIIFLHDIHATSFDRLNELKEKLSKTTSFLPQGEF
jgi:hypothetical protein